MRRLYVTFPAACAAAEIGPHFVSPTGRVPLNRTNGHAARLDSFSFEASRSNQEMKSGLMEAKQSDYMLLEIAVLFGASTTCFANLSQVAIQGLHVVG